MLLRARYLHVDSNQVAAVRFIQKHLPEGQVILVGNSQRHRVLMHDVMFCFLANRRSGTAMLSLCLGLSQL
jgi:hypothetical protein